MENLYEVPCFDMESKEFIKRIDPEHKKFEPIRMQAVVARAVRHEDTRPMHAEKSRSNLSRKPTEDRFTKDSSKDWEAMP